MKRISLLAAVLAVAAVVPAGIAGASGGRATLKLRNTSLGKILVNGGGSTLYAFTRDGHNVDNCVMVNGCSSVWPALTTKGKPTAGPGIKSSLIGTITLKGGKKQVTYAGHPLYTYSNGGGPGDTSYVNFSEFGGNWPAVNAAGHEVK